MQFEFRFLDYLQTLRNPYLDKIMVSITRLGDLGAVWIILILALVLYQKTRRVGMIASVALAMDLIICNVIMKNLFHRIRPFDINQAIILLIKRPADFSFPSGHTAASFSVAFAVWFAGKKKMAVAMFVLAALIAFSRMYLYVHYPTDILGGIAIGVITGAIANQIAKKRFNREE